MMSTSSPSVTWNTRTNSELSFHSCGKASMCFRIFLKSEESTFPIRFHTFLRFFVHLPCWGLLRSQFLHPTVVVLSFARMHGSFQQCVQQCTEGTLISAERMLSRWQRDCAQQYAEGTLSSTKYFHRGIRSALSTVQRLRFIGNKEWTQQGPGRTLSGAQEVRSVGCKGCAQKGAWSALIQRPSQYSVFFEKKSQRIVAIKRGLTASCNTKRGPGCAHSTCHAGAPISGAGLAGSIQQKALCTYL